MQQIVVLFNLRPGISASDYEAWAKRVDIPTVGGLKSIASFSVLKSTSLLGSSAPPPFQYIEIIGIHDMTAFGADIATAQMQRVAAQFGSFADAIFINTAPLA
ncbi:MAG: REDY-like protein HapK [Proteobacteria bacterium]|nr:REDY-like protein HapK [Pseudomonadota bacterium]